MCVSLQCVGATVSLYMFYIMHLPWWLVTTVIILEFLFRAFHYFVISLHLHFGSYSYNSCFQFFMKQIKSLIESSLPRK